MTEGVVSMFQSIPWFAWIPILGIVFGSIAKIIQMNHSHTERMEKIRQGIDPDGGKPLAQRDI